MKDNALREVVATVCMHKRGEKHKLLPDEETRLVATSEMNAMTLQPQMVKILATQINNMVVALDI